MVNALAVPIPAVSAKASPAFLRLMQAAREELTRGDSVSLEEIKRETR